MSGYHLSRVDREQIFATFSFLDSVHDLLEMDGIDQLFDGQHIGRLKSAATHTEKAFRHFLENLDEDEHRKLNQLIKQNRVIVTSRAHQNKNEATLAIRPKHLWDLAELAIENHCTDCKVKKYKACRVYKRLMNAYVPAAQTTNGDCPYRQ